MEEGVAGPEIKTIKEYQFMAKEKKNPNINNEKEKRPKSTQTLLCHWEKELLNTRLGSYCNARTTEELTEGM